MTDTHNPEGGFDPERRRQELVAELEAMGAQKVRERLGVLPYYNALENEITQSKRGIFVTHYFLTKWAPDLGQPATNIVLALQKLADKHSGETIASLESIASIASINIATLKRWLSTNERVWQDRTDKQRRQWQLLHEYWIKEIRRRYRQHFDETGHSQTRQTTNAIRVSIDDPIHPDDFARLQALAAERIANEEYEEWKRKNTLQTNGLPYEAQSAPHKRPKEIIRGEPTARLVEKSSYEAQSAPHVGSADGATRSFSDRLINVATNVARTQNRTGRKLGSLARDSRVAALTPEQRAERERTADLVEQTIKKLEGDRTSQPHRSAGYYRKVALLMDPTLIHEALAATQDAVQRERSGEFKFHKDGGPAAYFGGAVLKIALRQGIDLGMGQPPAERRIEPLAKPENAPAVTLPATTGAQVEGEASTPEEHARIHAEYFFPFTFKHENGRDPSNEEKQAAYQRRLEELRGGGTPT